MVNFGNLLAGSIDLKKLQKVIDLVWDNKDELADSARFAQELPDLIRMLASGLSEAGTQARAAGLALVGEDGASGATSTLGSSATRLGSITATLADIATFVAKAADDVKGVPLMGGAAKQLGSAATSMRGATKDLGGLADDLVGLAEILASVGAALGQLGDSLETSGSTAHGFMAPR